MLKREYTKPGQEELKIFRFVVLFRAESVGQISVVRFFFGGITKFKIEIKHFYWYKV